MGKENNQILSLGVVVLAFFMALYATFHFSSAEPIQPPFSENATLSIMAGEKGSFIFPLEGNVHPLGSFYVTIAAGHPNPKLFTFDLDAGSDVTWIQCDTDVPCHGCTLSPERRYKFNNNAIPCKDPLCAALQGDLHPTLCHSPEENCKFQIRYEDGSTCSGILVSDLFLFQRGPPHPPLVFGCGNELTGSLYDSHETSGVLGLGHSPGSIVSQLHDQQVIKKNVIGHFLAFQGGGFLFFGDDYVPSGLVWTPMIQSGGDYTSGPAQLVFDQQLVLASELDFIFDSGSTYSYFSAPVYNPLHDQVIKNLQEDYIVDPTDRTLSVCIKGPKPFESILDLWTAFKNLFLVFPEITVLPLPPENYFIINDMGNACLGILNGTEAGLEDMNVIGDVSMLNKVFIYDNDNKKIGWRNDFCTKALYAHPLCNNPGGWKITTEM